MFLWHRTDLSLESNLWAKFLFRITCAQMTFNTVLSCDIFEYSVRRTQTLRNRKSYSHGMLVEVSWNVMAHAQNPDFVFRRKGRVHLNRQGRQFNRLLAAEVCVSAVVMLDTTCSEVVWRVLATHSISPVSPSLPITCVTVCHQLCHSTAVYHCHDYTMLIPMTIYIC